MYTIELDCPPGNCRPSNLIEGVIAETGIEMADLTELSIWFGNFTWAVKPEAESRYKNAQAVIKERITSLYHAGLIRYGSW